MDVLHLFREQLIVVLFILQWALSLFFQSAFLHRYAAHPMYTMSHRVERMAHLLALLTMGSSYLVPRAYAILHREHHAYSDHEGDPHSPHLVKNLFTMMWRTKTRYMNICRGKDVESRFADGRYPEWHWVDTIGNNRFCRVLWIVLYTAIFWLLVTKPWQWILWPFTWVMGPVHGAIVNWCGHKYGYRNFENTGDESHNAVIFGVDFPTGGECFQNNHHHDSSEPNFAVRKGEIDLVFQVMRLFDRMGVIHFKRRKRTEFSMTA